MKNKYKKKKYSKSSASQSIFDQCIISSVILLAVLILNLMPSMKKFRLELKSQLVKNISPGEIKSFCTKNFNLLSEKLSATEDFQVDKKLIEQMKNEDKEINEIKKNSPNTI